MRMIPSIIKITRLALPNQNNVKKHWYTKMQIKKLRNLQKYIFILFKNPSNFPRIVITYSIIW